MGHVASNSYGEWAPGTSTRTVSTREDDRPWASASTVVFAERGYRVRESAPPRLQATAFRPHGLARTADGDSQHVEQLRDRDVRRVQESLLPRVVGEVPRVTPILTHHHESRGEVPLPTGPGADFVRVVAPAFHRRRIRESGRRGGKPSAPPPRPRTHRPSPYRCSRSRARRGGPHPSETPRRALTDGWYDGAGPPGVRSQRLPSRAPLQHPRDRPCF